ncbi:TPA_exp: putative COP9 signalosome subunit 6 (CsnF) [Trichophyton benhamiae CBS 112371]|uniref:COP9 signalosome complex subunit 6 n=1 Tax=Arthroderma benhamiae (strain ATCC MYA-4681 / CBS 112371) TaxID=663331 RepID=D4AIE2_ARTBC|nr:COP9 signalosome subunit 6 (CsnF), putative [Trichophyton benhamiae CBS 112371]EFE36515.1 COP9 signalosome subunit 6 (CsnF), putative [Trichophyton benhamiae CBS 112371]DAA79299.1 TPA_exp: putative COP9 signalosome subunit 6 (CsnF) [Trichophyton benhamiae CBS 112371]
MAEASNTLISSKSSHSSLHALLHPLVLLNISDHITRHAVRQQKGLIVGAILGQQNGRSITLEHVFDCNLVTSPSGEVLLHQEFFNERLQQFKDVHKSPALDLVGWFTVTPPSGPLQSQVSIHEQILRDYNEAAILLAFHSSDVENTSSTVGKLPISVYESVYEEDTADDGDRPMQGDDQQRTLALKFRPVPYSIETGEAEMISVDSIATGGGNATAILDKEPSKTKTETQTQDKEKRQKLSEPAEDLVLSPEDEDLIANLTTRLSAVKTLQSRIHLIKCYLQSIAEDLSADTSMAQQSTPKPTLSHSLLRSIYCVISHLALLSPENSNAFSIESLAQANDVLLTALLGSMGQNISQMRELGKKFAVSELTARNIVKESQLSSRMGGDLFHT